MSKGKAEAEVDLFDEDPDHAEAVREMQKLHQRVGRVTMEKALRVIEHLDIDEIPVSVAVSLLRWGADLERRALLGVEPDDDEVDPFEALSKMLASDDANDDDD